jgi:hypothetical protein
MPHASRRGVAEWNAKIEAANVFGEAPNTAREGPCALAYRLPATLASRVPPEWLSRRAVPGFGGAQPHQKLVQAIVGKGFVRLLGFPESQ